MNYLKLLEECLQDYFMYDFKTFLTIACVCLHFFALYCNYKCIFTFPLKL